MKKIIISLMIMMLLNGTTYAYTKSFEYMASVMNMELKTENGFELNEEVYNMYNQFAYGSPLDISLGQRWKDVSDGKWTKGGGAWRGNGIRGEYWVLGYNCSEDYVHNHSFPVDVEPPTSPTEWRYVYLPDAASSWNDAQLFNYEEQKTYMQTSKLMRNNITYDITAVDIGLDRAKVENYATWKTNGNIYTKRYDVNNKEWAANFIVPPMAADAQLVSKLEFPNGNTYTIKENEEEIHIPIEYGCEVVNLTDYAREEHVKKIMSEIIVNGKTICATNEERKTKLFDEGTLTINKNDYPGQSIVELEVSCNSMLITEFNVDGPLTDVDSKIIIISVEGREDEKLKVKTENRNYIIDAIPPFINSVTIGREQNGEIIDLKSSKATSTKFICAGQVLVVQIEALNTDYITLEFSGDKSINILDELTKKFEWDDPRSRGISTRYASLNGLKSAYKSRTILEPIKTQGNKTYYKFVYVIPYKTKQTLHSWSTLREISKDAFNIDERKLFSRIMNPYEIVIKAHSSEGIRTRRVSLDVFERWDTLYNRDISAYIK